MNKFKFVAVVGYNDHKMYPVQFDGRGLYIRTGVEYVPFITDAYNCIVPRYGYTFYMATYAEIANYNEVIDVDIMLKEACDGRC